MPLSSAQLVAQACQQAMVPGFTSQGGKLLNVILSDLCQDYNFDAARKTLQFNMPTAVDALGRSTMALPADYLRACFNECFYYINGVPYPLIPQDLDEMDMMVVTAGLSNFPVTFSTDMSTTPPTMYFWMPPSGAYVSLLRYQSQMADIVTPETSAAVPWFPNQNYLLTRLTGELCKIADDERHEALLGNDEERTPGGAGVILKRYLKLHGDNMNRAKTVKLDRRRFGSSFDRLKNTKQVGW